MGASRDRGNETGEATRRALVASHEFNYATVNRLPGRRLQAVNNGWAFAQLHLAGKVAMKPREHLDLLQRKRLGVTIKGARKHKEAFKSVDALARFLIELAKREAA